MTIPSITKKDVEKAKNIFMRYGPDMHKYLDAVKYNNKWIVSKHNSASIQTTSNDVMLQFNDKMKLLDNIAFDYKLILYSDENTTKKFKSIKGLKGKRTLVK